MTSKSDTRAVIGGKGANTREEIVARALNIVALEGLGALSIGGLAKELKMSKSGLFAHFGSKENLATAVVERASVLFFDHVLVPIEERGLEGIERVWALCDSWLDFVEQRTLPGGYFFTGAYFQCAGQSGSIPRQIKRVVRDWRDVLWKALDQARWRDEVRMAVDGEQVAFELNSILIGAQWSQLMTHTDHTNARSAILAKLASLATEEIPASAFESVRTWRKYLESRHE
ncbi:MAG: TetR/AcrR family transcriptional regulator [Terriglobales bacterium]